MSLASPEIDASSRLPALRETLEGALVRECRGFYGERLVSLVEYGSVSRGKIHPESDLDLLIVFDPWVNDYRAYCLEFSAIEAAVAREVEACARAGWQVRLSPIFKGRAAVEYGSPLFLDMVEDARILFDLDHFFARRLERLRERLRALGSKRIWEGETWYWDLKPDWQPGDIIEL